MGPQVSGETTNVTALFCQSNKRKWSAKGKLRYHYIVEKTTTSEFCDRGEEKKITMTHACAISIVRAVGVTKTVSHP